MRVIENLKKLLGLDKFKVKSHDALIHPVPYHQSRFAEVVEAETDRNYGNSDSSENSGVAAPVPFKAIDAYVYCNHFHELTPEHELIEIDGKRFVANKVAIPLLRALNAAGLKTRTHHLQEQGECFISVLISPEMLIEIRRVDERSSSRTEYNGLQEVLISWRR